MQTGEPSRTAYSAARYRADHQELERGAVFRDPLARAIAGDGSAGGYLDDDARRRMRLFIAARSRYAEDALGEAVAAGAGQVVVLGAGLDTFAYRNPFPRLRVFEVDHPDTQQWKRQRLAAAGIEVPASVTYVPVDFEHDALELALPAAGLDVGSPVFVIWLGVTVYLTADAISDTLRALGGLAGGCEMVFDYGLPQADVTPGQQAVAAERDRRLAAIGERWISRFTPDGISDLLHDNNFRVVENVPALALAQRYLGRTPTATAGPQLVRARLGG
ncbi:class I SAM-dependent methyltransferase [Nocardia sp. alder85J]|uniref:class I SAM-dependent methyltransferase n=1 Tax=Nocardia sp. alder85J TaxID=2862949 RepID=UPI001CD6BAED|nr:SAM-dependent methyltransferase [Nocardia sp. alder85J]MCX4095972.1 SAM-dependent methyltransferase [Nocardia sp. alder85J]